MTFRRRALALAVAGALAFGVAGCSGHPAATPSTPTPAFTSDAAAYAAAEKVYRDYVDALNQVDLADPKTFEPVFALTTGDANRDDRTHFSQMHADRWKVSGSEHIKVLQLRGPLDAKRSQVDLAVCLDVSEIRLNDSNGDSMVNPNRPDVQSMQVSVTLAGGMAKIKAFNPRTGDPQCD